MYLNSIFSASCGLLLARLTNESGAISMCLRNESNRLSYGSLVRGFRIAERNNPIASPCNNDLSTFLFFVVV